MINGGYNRREKLIFQFTPQYLVTLPDTLDTILCQIQRKEGLPLNTLINLWVQEKVQQYAKTM
ncbi:hypothetical protein THIOM_004434 [Candidatus Thiomargarita nelsonii]|uniref:Uncharacterized protein n=1 Tax=Candidatus Thiomargarita nelsonii TaxID=1003181 RepID=A0A176RVZ0_9GAMM|nr:hypothetical protein THIOM_004434 [Candidatus Thiomargarita nelsonii]